MGYSVCCDECSKFIGYVNNEPITPRLCIKCYEDRLPGIVEEDGFSLECYKCGEHITDMDREPDGTYECIECYDIMNGVKLEELKSEGQPKKGRPKRKPLSEAMETIANDVQRKRDTSEEECAVTLSSEAEVTHITIKGIVEDHNKWMEQNKADTSYRWMEFRENFTERPEYGSKQQKIISYKEMLDIALQTRDFVWAKNLQTLISQWTNQLNK